MDMKIVGISITTVVAIVVLASVLMPILEDSTAQTDTFTNDDYYYMMDKLDSSSTHTISWTKEANTKITVDDVDIPVTWTGSPIVYADGNNLVRCTVSNGACYLNLVGTSSANGVGTSSDQSITITIAEGVATFEHTTSGGTTSSVTSSFEKGYCIIPGNDGNYVLAKGSSIKHVLGNTEIFTMGYATISSAWQNVFSLEGTIDDGITVTFVSSTLGNDQTITTSSADYAAVDNYKGLYDYNKTSFTASVNGTTKDLSLANTIVPYKVVAERSQHLSDNEAALLMTIPVMLVIAILVGIVALVIRSRSE